MKPLFKPAVQMSVALLHRKIESSRTLRQSLLVGTNPSATRLPAQTIRRIKPPKAFTTLAQHIKSKSQGKSRLEAFIPLRARLTKIYRRPVFLQSNRLVAL